MENQRTTLAVIKTPTHVVFGADGKVSGDSPSDHAVKIKKLLHTGIYIGVAGYYQTALDIIEELETRLFRVAPAVPPVDTIIQWVDEIVRRCEDEDEFGEYKFQSFAMVFTGFERGVPFIKKVERIFTGYERLPPRLPSPPIKLRAYAGGVQVTNVTSSNYHVTSSTPEAERVAKAFIGQKIKDGPGNVDRQVDIVRKAIGKAAGADPMTGGFTSVWSIPTTGEETRYERMNVSDCLKLVID